MGMTRDPRTIPASTGVAADREFRAVAPPLYLTSTFALEGFERSLGHECQSALVAEARRARLG